MDITIETKNVYGNNLNYPICEKAKIFALLIGKKTLDYLDLNRIQALGYKIKFKEN
jgi:hypothetical protein